MYSRTGPLEYGGLAGRWNRPGCHESDARMVYKLFSCVSSRWIWRDRFEWEGANASAIMIWSMSFTLGRYTASSKKCVT